MRSSDILVGLFSRVPKKWREIEIFANLVCLAVKILNSLQVLQPNPLEALQFCYNCFSIVFHCYCRQKGAQGQAGGRWVTSQNSSLVKIPNDCGPAAIAEQVTWWHWDDQPRCFSWSEGLRVISKILKKHKKGVHISSQDLEQNCKAA